MAEMTDAERELIGSLLSNQCDLRYIGDGGSLHSSVIDGMRKVMIERIPQELRDRCQATMQAKRAADKALYQIHNELHLLGITNHQVVTDLVENVFYKEFANG